MEPDLFTKEEIAEVMKIFHLNETDALTYLENAIVEVLGLFLPSLAEAQATETATELQTQSA